MSVAQLVTAATAASAKWSIATPNTQAGLTVNSWTGMCWAMGTSLVTDVYRDLMGQNDTVAAGFGMGLKLLSGTNYNMNLGDQASDNIGVTAVTSNEWHHYCITAQPNGAALAAYGWLDGHLEIGPIALTAGAQANSTVYKWNSGAGAAVASQWVGVICACKIWDGVALNGDQIRREMMFYQAQRQQGLWATTPLFDTGTKAQIFGGKGGNAWTVTGTFTESTLYPPGVQWDAPLARRRTARFQPQSTQPARAKAYFLSQAVKRAAYY